jgi:hypothetical protein
MLEFVVQLSIMVLCWIVVCRIKAIPVQDGLKVGTLFDSDGVPRHNQQMQRSVKTGISTDHMLLWLVIVFYGGLRNHRFYLLNYSSNYTEDELCRSQRRMSVSCA